MTGADFAAGANLAEKNVKAQGTIFLPDDARRVRAVIVLAESWPGSERGVYDASGRRQDDADVPLRLRRPAGQPAEPVIWQWPVPRPGVAPVGGRLRMCASLSEIGNYSS